MFIYLAIYFFVSILAILHIQSKILFTILCFFLVLFVGLRHEVGGDWNTYLIMMQEIHRLDNVYISLLFTDPSYAFLNYIFSDFQDGIYAVNLVCASIFMFGFYKLCRNQPNPFFSLAIALSYLIFVVAMGYTRQSAALGFILLAFEAFKRNKIKRFIIYVLLATTFHMTAIVMMGLILFKERFRKKIIFLIIIFLPVILFLIDKIQRRMDLYGSNDNISSGGALLRLSLTLIPSIIFLLNKKFFREKVPSDYPLFLFLSTSSIFLFLLGFPLSTIADRLGVYFLIVQAIIFPYFISKFVHIQRKLVISSILLFYFIFIIVWFKTSYFAACCWINYQNYLFL